MSLKNLVTLRSALLLASLLACTSVPLEGQETMNCEQKLRELKAIFGGLRRTFNEQNSLLVDTEGSLQALRKELATLKTNSEQLQSELMQSRTESATLKAELLKYQNDLKVLDALLATAETRLTAANESFQTYKTEAEERVHKAEAEAGAWKIGGIVIGICGISAGIAAVIFFH